ncbi:MAG: multifunctional CCA tRNA nucleotidyl transferase/2'3'-cyclic phosphodiesterase/2'nucleotidase/phosphatase, partial [Pseudomonadales bacterium]
STQVTLEEDLARRDLTINSIARDNNGRLIDPYGGVNDLKNKILRHTTDAFVEDPVRVLRVARFLARYGESWSIHPDTLALMSELHRSGELLHLVPERVWKETEKALSERTPELYFETLNGLGIFPELEAMCDIPQPAKHHPEGDVFRHTMLSLARAADYNFDLPTRFAVLTHDFGKAHCYTQRGNLHGHEQAGLDSLSAFCQRLKVPNRFKTLAMLTCENHTLCHTLAQLTPKTLHKLLIEKLNAVSNPERFQQFLDACLCDAQGRGPSFRERAYPQRDRALAITKHLVQLDKKALVQASIQRGLKGPQISAAIREAEIASIKSFITSHQSEAEH